MFLFENSYADFELLKKQIASCYWSQSPGLVKSVSLYKSVEKLVMYEFLEKGITHKVKLKKIYSN